MPYKVLVVDDSQFFQRRLTDIINEHPDLQVVGVASNGREAVEKNASLQPDLISMDYEMPVLNGVSAIREIMEKRPTPILMFSSMTYEGARVTLDALEAGALDFVPKDFAEVSQNAEALKRKLHGKLLDIVKSRPKFGRATPTSTALEKSTAFKTSASSEAKKSVSTDASAKPLKGKVNVLIIGASTGGPVALTEVLTQLPENFPLPILLVQHMPESLVSAPSPVK